MAFWKRLNFWDAISDERKSELLGLLLIALSLLILVSLFTYNRENDLTIIKTKLTWDNLFNAFSFPIKNQAGLVGALVSYLLYILFGYTAILLPFFMLGFGIKKVLKLEFGKILKKLLYVFGIVFLLGIIFSIPSAVAKESFNTESISLGGWFALIFARFLVKIIGESGSYILTITLFLAALILIAPWRVNEIFLTLKFYLDKLISKGHRLRDLKRIRKERTRKERELEFKKEFEEKLSLAKEPEIVEEKKPLETPKIMDDLKNTFDMVRRKKHESNYKFPPLELLESSPYVKTPVSSEELNLTAKILKETLATFGISIEDDFIEKNPGPVITRYEFKPGPGIKVNQIVNLADDLALAMQARRIRIVAPIPGKAAIGVEIPNKTPQIVCLKEILTSSFFENSTGRLNIALGKTISGEPFVTDLARMPHLLIAGSTGSGKSVCINGIITSLLCQLTPEEIRFIMIDPKMLELSIYDGIPHLERKVVTKPKVAEKILSDTVVEMENRYKLLAKASVRNIEDYNRKKKNEVLPYIVIIVDELADLMMSSSTRTEALITRLAQMARAVGIHLILATQRPSVDVITGLIKANFSSRIAFQVASKIDSRTILDANGAEKLLGRGDMLFLQPGFPEPQRIHGALISSEETERVVEFIKAQNIPAPALEVFSTEEKEEEEEIYDEGEEVTDELYRQAVELVIRHKQGSVSLLQRRLGIGYQRAARLIDKLEVNGIVGPYVGSKTREVLVGADYLIEMEMQKKGKPNSNEKI
jgi:S-DNA-T family DNA segregation ATPase FtsK/SpoIIIE